MRLRISRRFLSYLAVAFLAGTFIALFLLLGPPGLLAKSESPDFCAGCHVMEDEHTAWRHSGPHARIKCVECHLPGGSPAEHYTWKAIDGMKDVVVFHTGTVPETITLSPHGEKVVQANCVKCHQGAVATMDQSRKCWSCHRQLRHRLTGIVGSRD